MKTANPEQTARRIKVSFSTDQYLRAHRASPKGRGHWGFCVERDGHYREFWISMATYTQAKRAAAAWARTNGRTLGWTGDVVVEVLA